MITSKDNGTVRRIRSLKEKKGRQEYGQYLIEGVKQVREACLAGADVETVIVSESYKGEIFLPERTEAVTDILFGKLTDECAPQGILAAVKIPDCAPRAPRGRCLLLDGIADPGNLGTIVRTANGAGYKDLYLRGCTDPFSPKCVRSAMSGLFFVRLHSGTEDALFGALDGVPLIAADMRGESMVSFTAPENFCLCIGSEANGLSDGVRERCVRTVSVPLADTCESLNAAVAAGILMYQLIRK